MAVRTVTTGPTTEIWLAFEKKRSGPKLALISELNFGQKKFWRPGDLFSQAHGFASYPHG